MTRFFTPRRLLLLALAALALLAALAGCSKKLTSVDDQYTQLEGTPDPSAQLMVWSETPTEVRYYDDLGTPGPSTSDTLLDVVQVYRTGAGAVQTMLLDGGLASGFEFFRRAANGGFQPMRDYVVNAPRKWLDSHWELYELTDSRPSGFTPATYVARGLLAGATTQSSPLTNAAKVLGPTSNTLAYFGGAAPDDSLFRLVWSPVAGAAGYWIHVYQFRSDALDDEKIASATPSPVWNGKVRDQFVGYVAAPSTSYKLGDSTGVRILTFKPPLFGQLYYVRITAVSDEGQVLAGIGTDLRNIRWDDNQQAIVGAVGGAFDVVQEEGRWKIFPLGAFGVNPTHPLALTHAPGPAGASRFGRRGPPAAPGAGR